MPGVGVTWRRQSEGQAEPAAAAEIGLAPPALPRPPGAPAPPRPARAARAASAPLCGQARPP